MHITGYTICLQRRLRISTEITLSAVEELSLTSGTKMFKKAGYLISDCDIEHYAFVAVLSLSIRLPESIATRSRFHQFTGEVLVHLCSEYFLYQRTRLLVSARIRRCHVYNKS